MGKAQKVFDRMMANDYCSQWMGVEALSIEEAACKIKMVVKKEMLNGFGILHGGIAYAFADSAFAFASNSLGRLSVSINGQMSFAKSAKEGDTLIAEAKALHIGNRTADFEVTITNESDQEKYYFFRGTVYRTSREVLD